MPRKLKHEAVCSWCGEKATLRRCRFDHYTKPPKYSCEAHISNLQEYEKDCGFNENDEGHRSEGDYQSWMRL